VLNFNPRRDEYVYAGSRNELSDSFALSLIALAKYAYSSRFKRKCPKEENKMFKVLF
jgi:hypothetical protein